MRKQGFLTQFLYLILYAGSGLFTLFWASVFFLGSEDTVFRQIEEHGLLVLFLKRFLGFAMLGGLVALSITVPSILLQIWRKQKDWSESKEVFKRALFSQVLCALFGSAFFSLSVRDSIPDVKSAIDHSLISEEASMLLRS